MQLFFKLFFLTHRFDCSGTHGNYFLEADSGLEPGYGVMSPLCYQLHQTAICIPTENRTPIFRMKT